MGLCLAQLAERTAQYPHQGLWLAGVEGASNPPLDDEGNEVMVYSKQWLPAEVAKISMGDDQKKNKASTMIKVQVGWVLLNYDDGVSLWTRLRQGQFNCTAVGSWRLDLDEAVEEGG